MFEASEEEVQKGLSANPPTATDPELDNERPDEEVLTAEIDDLWQDHEAFKSAIREESQTLRALRSELGQRLFGMKQLLARPGRGGQWSAWLAKRHIPRATADRLVNKHEQLLNPNNNCLNEAVSEPSEENIKQLLNAVLPKMRRVLLTPASKTFFLRLLAESFADIEGSGSAEQGFAVSH